MMVKSVSKLCRCCMKTGELHIFSTLYESQTIAEILEQIFKETISSEDLLPKTICRQCFNETISQFLFFKKYLRVQKQLLAILQREKLVDEKPETELSNVESDIFPNEFESIVDDQPLSSKSSHNICNKLDLNETSFRCEEIVEQRKPLDSRLNELKENLADCSSRDDYEVKQGKGKCPQSSHPCTECNESFKLMKQLHEHCKNTGHAFPRRYSCEICCKKFLSNSRLNDHLRVHNNERPFSCYECGMTFTLSSNLKRHEKRHTGEKSYFCEVCGKGFIQKHTLSVHVRLHNGETPYICELCGKGYRAKPLLQQHMYKHKDAKKQTLKYQKYYLKYGKMKVECKVCKKILTKSALYNHMTVQHGDGMKKFLCNLCGKTYATKISLDVHMNIHTKQISYDCNVCSKSFTHQNYLKTHLLQHSGERPHCCDVCGKTFVQRSHLDRHKRTHTGARPYACTYCDKAFALNENLKVHIRTHTKETPHICSVCGKGFFNSSSKKKHETNVHRK